MVGVGVIVAVDDDEPLRAKTKAAAAMNRLVADGAIAGWEPWDGVATGDTNDATLSRRLEGLMEEIMERKKELGLAEDTVGIVTGSMRYLLTRITRGEEKRA